MLTKRLHTRNAASQTAPRLAVLGVMASIHAGFTRPSLPPPCHAPYVLSMEFVGSKVGSTPSDRSTCRSGESGDSPSCLTTGIRVARRRPLSRDVRCVTTSTAPWGVGDRRWPITQLQMKTSHNSKVRATFARSTVLSNLTMISCK